MANMPVVELPDDDRLTRSGRARFDGPDATVRVLAPDRASGRPHLLDPRAGTCSGPASPSTPASTSGSRVRLRRGSIEYRLARGPVSGAARRLPRGSGVDCAATPTSSASTPPCIATWARAPAVDSRGWACDPGDATGGEVTAAVPVADLSDDRRHQRRRRRATSMAPWCGSRAANELGWSAYLARGSAPTTCPAKSPRLGSTTSAWPPFGVIGAGPRRVPRRGPHVCVAAPRRGHHSPRCTSTRALHGFDVVAPDSRSRQACQRYAITEALRRVLRPASVGRAHH
jgi:hypothetical protein